MQARALLRALAHEHAALDARSLAAVCAQLARADDALRRHSAAFVAASRHAGAARPLVDADALLALPPGVARRVLSQLCVGQRPRAGLAHANALLANVRRVVADSGSDAVDGADRVRIAKLADTNVMLAHARRAP